jgi:glycerol-1-phosphate dehydrogenase [NAD(P)+]
MASAVVVDVDVVGSAPLSMLRAGLGDLVSNITAALDWRLAARDFGEAFDAVAAATAEGAAAAVLDMGSLRDPQAVKALAEGLLMSGLAMAVAGTSRPCSGSEHLVSHALDHILGQDARLHGEQVALGTLVALAAHGVDDTPVRRLFQRCGVPVHPAEIGLRSEDLAKAVSLGPSLRPDRRTILDNFADDNERTAQLVNAVFFRLAVAA